MYRVIDDPSPQVQKFIDGRWRTVYYCASRESAERCKAEQERRQAEWDRMSDDERMRSILR